MVKVLPKMAIFLEKVGSFLRGVEQTIFLFHKLFPNAILSHQKNQSFLKYDITVEN